MERPRLYLTAHCTPGTEWLRLTPIKVPKDKLWTAKEDARYISPIVGTPGYRHTVELARSWHFLTVYGFVLTGVFFVCACLASVGACFPERVPRGLEVFCLLRQPSASARTKLLLCL